MKKLDYVFDRLLELEECRHDESVPEYIKIFEIDVKRGKARLSANELGIEKIKNFFKYFHLSYQIFLINKYDDVSDYEILDIGA